MRSTRTAGVCPGVIFGIACAAISTPALAVDEIIVTAQRREESLQEVPLAVSAFDESRIENLQIDVIKDIGQNVPNLQTYTITAGAQAIQVHARGASVQNPGFNLAESPVGIYIDDVYFGRLASVNLELSDVERIEALRGPQGTLYGRNTIAGAIKVVTKTPDDDPWIDASIGLGNYETTKAAFSAGGPLSEGSLAASVALLYDERNKGWMDNGRTGATPGEYENMAARGKLHFYGSEGFDAVLTGWWADLENDGYNGVPYVPFSNNPNPDIGYAGTANPSFDPAPAGGAPQGGFYETFAAAGVNYGESDQAGANLALTFDFGAAQLRSITGYAEIDDRFGFDLAGGGADFGDIPELQFGLRIASDSEFEQISQEIQLLGEALDDRLAWQLGVFYLNEDGDQTFSGTIPAPLFDGDPVSTADFVERIQNETDSYAVYGEATWRFTDQWSATGGLRWTQDDKEYTNDCTGGFCVDELGVPGTASVALEDDWDETTLKLGVDYQINENQLAYLTWQQGFQAGGFRTLCFGDLTALCGGSTFDPQTVNSYEIGLKSDLFDNRVRLNVAAFLAQYDDIQQIVIVAGGGTPIDNIGEVDVYGAEMELVWTPIEGLNVFANLGFQESDFGDVRPQSPPGGLAPPDGIDPDTVCPNRPDPTSRACARPVDELSSNPGWQGKVGFDYTISLPNELAFFYGLDVFHSDDYYTEARNLAKIDDYTRLNGFIGFGNDEREWQVVLTAKNITDEEDNVGGIFANGFTNIRTAQPPAEYMVNFKVNY